MKTTRILLLVFAAFMALGGLSVFASPDAVLARCYPSGELADPSRYYVRHWATGTVGMGLFAGLVAWRGDRSSLRLGLGVVAIAYLTMSTNFWIAKTAGWIPYLRPCVVEEISIEIAVAVLLTATAIWEFVFAPRAQARE